MQATSLDTDVNNTFVIFMLQLEKAIYRRIIIVLLLDDLRQ